MNTKPKLLWITALRSGEYKQVCNTMRSECGPVNKKTGLQTADMTSNNMCVMGVLAEVALKASGLKPTVENWLKFADTNEYPSKRTLEWAGLNSIQTEDLISDNDGGRKTFAKFATYIEKNL